MKKRNCPTLLIAGLRGFFLHERIEAPHDSKPREGRARGVLRTPYNHEAAFSFTKSIAYKLLRELSFSSFPAA